MGATEAEAKDFLLSLHQKSTKLILKKIKVIKKIILICIAAITFCGLQAQNNWERIELPDSVKIQQLYCLDKNTVFGWGFEGWSVGDIIYKTNDGGGNWKIVFKRKSKSKGFSPMIMSFVNQKVGFLLIDEGYLKTTVLYKTTDSGESWIRMGETPINNTGLIKKLLAIDEEHIWIHDNLYSIWISSDGGINFKEFNKPPTFGLCCAIGCYNDICYAVVTSSVYKMTKKGNIVSYIPNILSGEFVVDTQQTNDIIVHSSESSTFGGKDNLCVTKDGFNTISKYPYPKYPGKKSKIAFYDNKHGMFLRYWTGDITEKTELYYTENGGKSWILEEIEDVWILDIAGKNGVWYCVNYDGEIFKTDKFVGVSEIEVLSLGITPNPVTDIFNIECGDSDVKLLEIYDITGRVVFKQKSPTQSSVNIQHLTNGIYIAKLYTENQIFNAKIIKQ